MGYDRVEMTVYAQLSRHNSERDRIANQQWELLQQRIQELLNDEQFSEIEPWT